MEDYAIPEPEDNDQANLLEESVDEGAGSSLSSFQTLDNRMIASVSSNDYNMFIMGPANPSADLVHNSAADYNGWRDSQKESPRPPLISQFKRPPRHQILHPDDLSSLANDSFMAKAPPNGCSTPTNSMATDTADGVIVNCKRRPRRWCLPAFIANANPFVKFIFICCFVLFIGLAVLLSVWIYSRVALNSEQDSTEQQVSKGLTQDQVEDIIADLAPTPAPSPEKGNIFERPQDVSTSYPTHIPTYLPTVSKQPSMAPSGAKKQKEKKAKKVKTADTTDESDDSDDEY